MTNEQIEQRIAELQPRYIAARKEAHRLMDKAAELTGEAAREAELIARCYDETADEIGLQIELLADGLCYV